MPAQVELMWLTRPVKKRRARVNSSDGRQRSVAVPADGSTSPSRAAALIRCTDHGGVHPDEHLRTAPVSTGPGVVRRRAAKPAASTRKLPGVFPRKAGLPSEDYPFLGNREFVHGLLLAIF